MGKDTATADAAAERTSKLPDELQGAHENRFDAVKWKLLLVAGLGAAGLGLQENQHPIRLLLALIPFVCIYVDLICTTLNVRIIVIGKYYGSLCGDQYECFADRNRAVFQMEDWALNGSTKLICGLITSIGLVLFLRFLSEPDNVELLWSWPFWPAVLFLAAGLYQTGGMLAAGKKPGDYQVLLTTGSIVIIEGALLSQLPVSNLWQWPFWEPVLLILAGTTGFMAANYTLAASKKLLEKLTFPPAEPAERSPQLVALLQPAYVPAQLTAVRELLTQKGVFIFQCLPNGLFPAAAGLGEGAASGYQNVWVRDNIYVAFAHYICGDPTTAERTLVALMVHFQKNRSRFQDIIANPARAQDPMNRPHIRFAGENLADIKAPWPHAQNDALGYFLWCYCKMAQAGDLPCGIMELECLAEFPLYFHAIQYWRDEDSGHWEEQRKVSASSIGAVVAGLREFERLLEEKQLWPQPPLAGHHLTPATLRKLQKHGVEILAEILPCEALIPAGLFRRYDSALLFLIYPLHVVEWPHARVILEDVQTHLQGEYGIRRYLGDSYWHPDYRAKMKTEKRAADYSSNRAERDAGSHIRGEAQWCIFDPIISVIYGERYLALKQTGAKAEADEMLRLQTVYFNRALGQLTGKSKSCEDFLCPEAYCLENGNYVPNDQTPLLWTQANLWLALHQMQISTAATSTNPVSGIAAKRTVSTDP